MDHLTALSSTIYSPPLLPSVTSQSPAIVTVPQDASQDNRTGFVIAKIEDIFASMVDALAGENSSLAIPYRSRGSASRAEGILKFPGSSVQEATKFSESWSRSGIEAATANIIPPQPG